MPDAASDSIENRRTGDAEEILSHGLDKHLTKPLRKPAIFEEILDNCPEGITPPQDEV